MSESASIQDAINRGLKEIALPSRIIIISGVVLGLLMVILGFSWLNLLWLPAGLLLSSLYTMFTTPKWRIWAYENVADIHQLQRSAEFAGLLQKNSYDKRRGIMSRGQRERLVELQNRFSEDCSFNDDETIPQEVNIYHRTLSSPSSEPILVIDDRGIDIQSEGFFDWSNIRDERIVYVGRKKMLPRTGGSISGSSRETFRFECPIDTIEIPLADLDISAWKLDLLLYICRGRYNLKVKES